VCSLGQCGANAILILAGSGLLPGSVMAQSGWFVEPSFSVMQRYDDNIFISDFQPEADSVLQARPAVNTGYRSISTVLNGYCSFDMERYRQNPELDSDHARTSAGLNVRYDASELLTVSAESSHIETQTPGELTPDTGLELGRARAEHTAFSSAAVYSFDHVDVGTISYGLNRYELTGGADSDVHTLSLDLNRRLNRSDALSMGYRFDEFQFDGTEAVDAHTLLFGASRELTRRTTLSLKAGPRYSGDSVDPEVSASLGYRFDRGQAEVSYDRSQTLVVGHPGTIETEGVRAAFSYSFGAHSGMRIGSSVLSSSSGELEADVYALDIEANWRIGRYLNMTSAYGYSSQRGSIDIPTFGEINRNVVWLGLVVAPPVGRASVSHQ
jgi:hypothetical protein